MSAVATAWPSAPARRVLVRVSREPTEDAETVTAFRDGHVVRRSERRTEGFTESTKDIGYQGVAEGNLVVHSMDGFAGAIGVSESNGKMSPVVHIYTAGPSIDLRFVQYYLRHLAACGYITSLAKGIRERSTSFDPAALADVPIPQPPLSEQRRIADFLDDQVARIDNIIGARRRQVGLLWEAAYSFVAREVLGSSGDLVPVRRLIGSEQLGTWGAEPSGDTLDTHCARVADFDRPVFRLGTVTTLRGVDDRSFLTRRVVAGDILLERSGGTNRNPVGCAVLVEDSQPRMVCSNFVSRVRAAQGVDSRYLSVVLAALYATGQQRPHSTQTTGIQNLDTESYFSIRVPAFGVEHQRALGVSMTGALTDTRNSAEPLTSSLVRFEELKRSLITAAVTGGFDVWSADGSRVPA